MATLVGRTSVGETGTVVDAELTIEPVPPSAEQPRDAYRVRIGPNNEGVTVDSELILDGYPGAHNEVKRVAEMFREADGMLTLPKSRIGASRCGVMETAGWADFHLIEGATRMEPHGIDVAVYVRDLVRNGPDPLWLRGRCTAFYLRTSLKDATAFGESLIAGLIAAWQKRQELGLAVGHEGDDWPAYFAEDPVWLAHFGRPDPSG